MADIGMTSSDVLPLSHSICCKICFCIYKEPKILPCLHSFCLPCLQRLQEKADDKHQITCPSCQQPFILLDKVEGLMTNALLLKSIQRNMQSINIPSIEKIQTSRPKYGTHGYERMHQTFSGTNLSKYLVESISDPNLALKQEMLGKDLMVKSANTEMTRRDELLCDRAGRDKIVDTDSKEVDTGNENSDRDTVTDKAVCKQVKTDKKKCNGDKTEIKSPQTEVLITPEQEQVTTENEDMKKRYEENKRKIQNEQETVEMRMNAIEMEARKIFNNLQQKENLRHKLCCLQTEAINIVHSIDSLNEDGFQWQQKKKKIHQDIKDRSDYLQEVILRLERKLLFELETYQMEQEAMRAMHDGKIKLHGILKNILTTIDFVRMLLDYGEGEEFEEYTKLIDEKMQNLSGETVKVDQTSVSFDVPPLPAEDKISKIYGHLELKHLHDRVWSFETAENNSDTAELEYDDLGFQQEVKEWEIDKVSNLSTLSHIDPQQKSFSVAKNVIDSHNLSPRHATMHRIRRPSYDIPEVSVPAPILEEASSNDVTNAPDESKPQYNPQIYSPKYTASGLGRRYTTGDIGRGEINISQYLRQGHLYGGQGHLYGENGNSHRSGNISNNQENSKLQFSEELDQTKKVLAMCKKQLLEAKTGVLPIDLSAQSEWVSIPQHPDYPVFRRGRLEQLRQNVRQKRWRYSIGSIDELL